MQAVCEWGQLEEVVGVKCSDFVADVDSHYSLTVDMDFLEYIS